MKRVHRLLLLLFVVSTAALLYARPWSDLETGNARFRTGRLEYTGLNQARERDLPPPRGRGQQPKVTILTCADSRVPPELIFGQSLGQLFVVRIAGNVADSFGLASLKYAKSQAGFTDTVIVLSHEDCGAVKEAMRPLPTDPDVRALLQRIKTNIGNETDLVRATQTNARRSAADVQQKVGLPAVKAAYYEMSTGRVIELAP